MGGTGLGVCLLLTLAAPPVATAPAPRPTRPEAELARENYRAAAWLTDLANLVVSKYPRKVTADKLLTAGLTALYEKAGRKLPAGVADSLAAAGPADKVVELVTDALNALGRTEGMTAADRFVTAANGFARVTDPYSGLIWRQPNHPLAVSEAEFGLGFEIEGAVGAPWVAYLLDAALSRGESARPPVGVPWVVRRVIPGSPAAKAGLRPGDRITHLDGDPITAASNPDLFRRLVSVSVPTLRDPAVTVDSSKPIVLRVDRRGSDGPVEIKLSWTNYCPESVFGVTRRDDGTWDWMLDREAKVGYVRLGAVESNTQSPIPASSAADLSRALTELDRDGAKALILDLRWTPGGYVPPTLQVIGAFLPRGKTIATVQGRAGDPSTPQAYYTELPPGLSSWSRLPLAVLVGAETTGGGEMIAAALQDHGRAVVVGQRTFGKANIMSLIDTPLPGGLGYRVSSSFTLRPNGKNRHRFPDSKPTDDWGVHPDKGFEVPLTPDLSARLRMDAERHVIRPPGSTAVVAFDDPLADPQRMVALKLLKEKLKTDERGK